MKIKALLSTFLLTVLLPAAGYAASDDSVYAQRYSFLKGVGIINDTEVLEDVQSLTRAQFVSLIVDAANFTPYENASEKIYTDVAENHKNFKNIHAALEYGYISPGEYFLPEDEITFEQAGTIMCRALGYTMLAEAAGGYPDGYMKAAYDFSLFDDVKRNEDNKVSFREAVNLIYNFVNADLFDINMNGSSLTYEKNNDKSLLTERYNVFLTKGVINANEYTDLLSTESGILKNEVKINDVVYRDENALALDYVGYYSQTYYQIDETDDVKNIVYVNTSERNVTKKILAKDLIECNNDIVTYDDGTSKIRKINISPIMSFIVNGRMRLITPQYLKSIKKGELTFVSNDGDETYDVCIVSDYSTTIITGVSMTEQFIACDNGTKIDFKDEDFDNIIIKDGEKISFAEIKRDDVVLIAESEGSGKNLRTILVSDKILTEKISNVGEDTLEIAGTLYKSDTGINEKVKIGRDYKIYVDYYGNVCHIISEIDIVYGYLYKAYCDESSNDKVEFKIFTENDRVVTLKLRDKVSLNGTTVNATELINTASSSYVAPKQMIRYKVNSDAQITTVDTAELIKIGSQAEKKAIEDDKFRISFDDTGTWRSNSKTFDGMFYADKNTKIFVIPDENDLATFSIKDINSLSGDSTYTITAYDADEFHAVKVIMMKGFTKKINHNSKFMIITSTGKTLNSEDEVVPLIEGFWSGDKLQFPVKVSETLTEDKVYNLKRGDLILFTYDDFGNINQISTYSSKFYISSGRYAYFTVIGGIVSKIDYSSGRIMVNYLGDDSSTFSDCCMIFSGKTAAYIYNRSTNEYQIASVDDIMPGDEVYINSSYLTCKEIIIIR